MSSPITDQEHRTMHASPLSRRRRSLTALMVTLGAVALAPAASSAATYSVQECHSGSSFTSDGVAGSYAGQYAYRFAACDEASRFLGGSFDPAIAHNLGDHGQVTVTAPSGTSLASIAGARDGAAGIARADGAPVAHLFTPSGDVEVFAAVAGYVGSANGPINLPLGGASSVSWGVACTGNAGCPAGDSHYFLRDVTLTLNDDGVPSLSQVSGSLLSGATTVRSRSLTFAAADAGSGVFRQRLVIDGTPRAAETVDANGGRCAQPFATRVPCQREITGTASLDTATLSDGTHELSLDVRDATDANRALHGPWSITVDNQPPVVGAPTLTGTAREGDTLTCAASVDGQSPTVSFQWLRAQTDGSGAAAITGATNAAYTVTAADIGRKLICRVSGRDAGGTASRDSLITQVPFDNGKTVEPYCSGRATGARDECGDLDRDGTVNRVDDDIDGDGTPNVNDVDPYDPTKPAPTPKDEEPPLHPNNPPVTDEPPVTPGPVGAAGTVKFLLGKDTAVFVGRRARWSRSAFTLTGRLTDASGQPLAGLRLHASQVVNGKTVALGDATSTSDGSWSFRVPRGPSRLVTVAAGDGVNAATMTVQQRVLAQVTFRAVNRRVARGGLVRFRGTLSGGYTNTREKLVEFQVHYRGAWRTIGNLRVDRRGRFAVRYRFGTAAYGRYTFRARTLPTDGYPFEVGVSRGRAASVRVG